MSFVGAAGRYQLNPVTGPAATEKETIVPTRHGAPLGAPTWIDLSSSDTDRAPFDAKTMALFHDIQFSEGWE